jgi:predicted DNA-binding transcriptional regulator AlpA
VPGQPIFLGKSPALQRQGAIAVTRRNPPKQPPPRRRAPMQAFIPSDSNEPTALIFKNEVLRRVGYTYPSLWRMMRDGKFPMSVDVGGKTAWHENEINKWIRERPRSNLKKSEG